MCENILNQEGIVNKLFEKIMGIEIIRYGLVGAVSTVIDYAILNIASYLMAGDPTKLWLATAFGFAGGLTNGYYMNSRWTFKYNTKGQEPRKFSQFAVVSLVGLGLTELIVLTFANSYQLDKNVAKLIAVVVVFFWNYFGNKLWTFKKS